MPGDGEEVNTQPVAGADSANTAETENADPRDGASKGIIDRLNRLEKKFERERLAPLQAQLDAVKQKAEENGLDLALLGFSGSTEASKPEPEKPAKAQEQEQVNQDSIELLRYKAAMKYKLSQEVLPLVTATTADAIEQQVQAILALNPVRRRSPIQPGPDGKALPTFTRTQLRDGAFFAAHKDAIQQAVRDGRIEDDTVS